MVTPRHNKPWPETASKQYDEIVARTIDIVAFANALIKFGLLAETPNVSFLEKAPRRMAHEIKNIISLCKMVGRLHTIYSNDKNGRWPQWVMAAIMDTVAIAEEISEDLEKFDVARKRQSEKSMIIHAEIMRDLALKMRGVYLEEGGPEPETSDPVAEARSTAAEAWGEAGDDDWMF